jgi:integrase
LSEARLKMAECRKFLAAKIDPIEARNADNAKARLAEANKTSFEDCTNSYIDAHRDGWKNEKHIQQWSNTLKTYVFPVIGKTPIQDINVDSIMKVLEPIWKEKTETANRTRGRIEKVLDWASARELRQGENPARWRGRLENLLPRRSKIQKVIHHPALPYAQVGDFIETLKLQPGLDARALELTILTATRTNEVLAAKWEEIDFSKKEWVIPAERMKARKEHRVPLTDKSIAVLKNVMKLTSDKEDVGKPEARTGWVFPGRKKKTHLSGMAMLMLLRRMERQDITVHGFRSTFRDWAAEQTVFPREIAEVSLAHATENKVEAAYLRSDLFDRRRKLMEAWSRYCSTPSPKDKSGTKVVNLAERQRR